MRMGKIIDEMIEPVIKEAQHNVEHGKLHYSTAKACVSSDASEGVSFNYNWEFINTYFLYYFLDFHSSETLLY